MRGKESEPARHAGELGRARRKRKKKVEPRHEYRRRRAKTNRITQALARSKKI